MESGSKNLVEEEFIQKLVPDPSQPPDVGLLTGYLGKSSRPGHSRLYLTLELSSYVDIPDADILHTQSLKNDGNLLGGTLVWVNRDADLKSTTTTGREMQADFLRGSIASQATTRARSSAVRALPPLPSTFTVTECATCPTNDRDTCFPATCTLTICYTQVIIDPGCGRRTVFY